MHPERWQSCTEIFNRAVEQPANERGAFLERNCDGDEALRRRVELLLKYHDTSGDFIKSPAFEAAPELLSGDPEALIGQHLGSYRIDAVAGVGGMGVVYLAWDERLGRKVALKLLPQSMVANEAKLGRLKREARTASALNHPNIVTIHEIGEVDSTHYVATEFIEGTTLRERMTKGLIPPPHAVEIAAQVTSALCVAHHAGIVHRDIKPENIMLRPDGYVKVLDFGIAKLTQQEPVGTATTIGAQLPTGQTMMLGTTRYMSPEQARGQAVDARSDLWSLGVVFYEMLAGRAPFEGEKAADVIAAIFERDPQPLKQRAPGVSPALQSVVNRSLRKDPAQRYQTAEEMLSELRAIKQRTDGIAARSARWVAPAAIAALLVSLALFYAWRGGRTDRARTPAPPEKSIAVLPLENASDDPNAEYLSEGISETLINSLTELHQLRVVARSTAFHYKGKHIDPRQVGRELHVTAVLTGRVRQMQDALSVQVDLVDATTGAQLWGAGYDRKISDVIAVKQAIAQEVIEKLKLILSGEERRRLVKRDSANAEAYQFYLQGRYFWNKRTEEGLRKGIGSFQRAIDTDPNYALAYVGLADSYNFLGAFGIGVLSPREAMPKAKSAAMKALQIDDSLAEAHASMAFVQLYFEWDWSGAEKSFRRAIELNPNYAPAHQWYSHLLMSRGRTGDSIAEAMRAAEIDPLSLPATLNVGWQYHWSRQYDLAIERLRKVLELDANFEQGHWGLGLALEGSGLPEEAAAEFQRAIDLSGGNTVYVAALSHAYGIGGRETEARKVCARLEEESRYVSPYWMATLQVGLGDTDQAFQWLEKAYEERSGGFVWLAIDPRMDGLRSDSRFADLLRRTVPIASTPGSAEL